MKLGENIKFQRKNAKLTQKQLAEKIGVTTITIQNYENNRREPNMETLKKIADALEVPIQALTSDNPLETFISPNRSLYDILHSMLIGLDQDSETKNKLENLAKKVKEESREVKTNKILNRVNEVLKEELPFNEEDKEEICNFIKDILEMKIKSMYDKK